MDAIRPSPHIAPSRAVDPALRAELDGCVVKPWLEPSDAMSSLAALQADAAAFETLRKVERRGLWGDGRSAAVQDAALLRAMLPEGASLSEAAAAYDIVFAIEASQHTDPTPSARRAMGAVLESLRPDESPRDAAEAYVSLFKYVVGKDINPSENAVKAYRAVAEHLVDSQSRVTAAQIYARGPEKYAERQGREQEAFEARQAEVKRVAEAVSREPREAGQVEVRDEWIIVGSVRVQRRRA